MILPVLLGARCSQTADSTKTIICLGRHAILELVNRGEQSSHMCIMFIINLCRRNINDDIGDIRLTYYSKGGCRAKKKMKGLQPRHADVVGQRSFRALLHTWYSTSIDLVGRYQPSYSGTAEGSMGGILDCVCQVG